VESGSRRAPQHALGVHAGRVQVGHRAARAAHQVVVRLRPRVVHLGAAQPDHASHEPDVLEQVECRVDRGQRHAGQVGFDLGQQALGREVAVQALHVPEDHAALWRHPSLAGADGGDEPVGRVGHLSFNIANT